MGNVKNISRLHKNNNTNSQEYIRIILETLKDISYGSVKLVLQDGVLIQVETNEKIRLK
ncbi:MAG: YezD family protein [Clostridium sp.]|uniref:YezD family protein n=1 Tax=Clostridium sp. TaxID=1506 RepID=UPI0039ED0773